jgi:glycosyltransferase involved in cell wall biosynthesis
MHGDYEEFYEKIKLDKKVVANYLSFIRTSYTEIDVIGYLSDRNLISLKLAGNYPDLVTRKIYNGFYGLYKDHRSKADIRKELGIPEEAIVFVMVARVVEGKGWAELIDAFNKMNEENTWLLLIGDGPALNELKLNSNNKNKRVVFTGNHANPIDLVKVCDVGVLPSKFRESLPNSIMEYLFCGVPVIATAVGEIPYMLNVDEAPAGIAITFPDTEENSKAYKDDLYNALKLMLNAQEYNKYKKNTESAFRRFDMETCYQEYFQLLNRS